MKSPIPDDAKEIPADGTISDDGNYVVSGNFGQTISITGGKPHVYLNNAHISVNSGPAISVTGDASATIHVLGENSVTAESDFASGIYVATGSSVTITGNSKEEDVLRVTGGTDGAAIGGYSDYVSATNCGDITISNVTLHAEVRGISMNTCVPGIGSTDYASCGTITITDAIVYARSYGSFVQGAPAIGAFGSVPEIVITNSEVYAQRGGRDGQACGDYIGRGGDMYIYQGGAIQCGTGSITNSTIYKETYDWSALSLSDDGSVYYNDQGIPEEKTE